MDRREALHTAARRHCIERHAHWVEAYRGLQASGRATKAVNELRWEHSREASATFPRYLVWETILNEVERLEPRSVANADALRDELASTGWRAETVLTTNPELPSAAHRAMAEERQEFRDFIGTFAETQLDAVEPLPLRRVFGVEELSRVWAHLAKWWDARPGYCWWPLRDGTTPLRVVAFHTDWFDAAKMTFVRDVLSANRVHLVWGVREFGEWGCEKGVESFEPVYNGEEG
jgi:hypothetical protein